MPGWHKHICTLRWIISKNKRNTLNSFHNSVKWTHCCSNSKWYRICNIDSQRTITIIANTKTKNLQSRTKKSLQTLELALPTFPGVKLTMKHNFSSSFSSFWRWSRSKRGATLTRNPRKYRFKSYMGNCNNLWRPWLTKLTKSMRVWCWVNSSLRCIKIFLSRNILQSSAKWTKSCKKRSLSISITSPGILRRIMTAFC